MARLLYRFLPGSGWGQWKGHISFQSVANQVGVGDYWRAGSKEPAIAGLLERTLEYHRNLLEKLILTIVKEGLKYCQKSNQPVTEDEIKTLNGLILEVGFKFPSLWDPMFIRSLRSDGHTRASELVEQELTVQKSQISEQSEFAKRRETLKAKLYSLWTQSNRQQAGFELEGLLNGLFELYGLNPRGPFRVSGEQIDGSFELDNEIYLVEAKWESAKLSEAPLLVFRGKVEGKSSFTRGLFLSLSGYNETALTAITRGKQPNFFLMDGYDLSVILEGQIRLDALLRTKLRFLAEEGKMFVSAKDCT
jgi:hypothetical protein